MSAPNLTVIEGGAQRTARVLPFPPARRVDLVWRQARYIANISRAAGERHLQRQVELQRQRMAARGIPASTADDAAADFETAVRHAVAYVAANGWVS